MARRRYYVGYRDGRAVAMFPSETTPTATEHGSQYAAVVGPFVTKRGALWAFNNRGCHFGSIAESERAAKRDEA